MGLSGLARFLYSSDSGTQNPKGFKGAAECTYQ
jgi:hypothetical protein